MPKIKNWNKVSGTKWRNEKTKNMIVIEKWKGNKTQYFVRRKSPSGNNLDLPKNLPSGKGSGDSYIRSSKSKAKKRATQYMKNHPMDNPELV
jgi:hypothetical protein